MQLRRLGLLLLLPLGASAQAPRDTLRYSLRFSDRPAGALTFWGTPAESWADFEYTDRGRGPHVVQHTVFAANGTPRLMTITGHDYLKDTVDERFTTDARTMHWVNSAEGDQQKPARAGYYIDVGGVTSVDALVRALLKTPDRRLPLLPAGEARLARLAGLTLRTKDEQRTVVAWAITGLGFTPVAVWLDRDGRLFGQVSGWFSCIRAGWESAVPQMVALQDSLQAVALRGVTAHLAHRLPTGRALVFRHAAIFDAAAASVRPHGTVIIRGDRIIAAGNDGEVAVPAGASRSSLAPTGSRASCCTVNSSCTCVPAFRRPLSSRSPRLAPRV